jgi:fucose 4-O-acetylase-like acetyltransferase
MAASPADTGALAWRNRYLDLLRVLAITMVVLGHWLLTSISYQGGQLSGVDAMSSIRWSGWVTLVFQVMPIFFLVGGSANALSWTRYRARGGVWAGWVRHRAIRLLRPATVFVAVAVVTVEACRLAGASPAELSNGGWAVALQLWFLPVYLVLIVLTPALQAAHRRWGLAVPAAFVLGAAAVDACVLGARLPLLGYANYVLVWGSMHQWGFAWRDRMLTRWRPYALAASGAVVLCCLLAWGPFPVDMIGAADGQVSNTVPPSVALLAFAAVQAGLVLAAEPAMSRLLARRRIWHLVSRLNDRVLTIYLWHMAPVIVVAVALYPGAGLAQPVIGSAQWWEFRPLWIAALAVVLAPAALWLPRFERPLRRRRAPGPAPAPRAPTALASVLVALGVAAAGVTLTRIALFGFAPGGSIPVATVAGYGCGVILTVLAGRLLAGGPMRTRLAVSSPGGPMARLPGRAAAARQAGSGS